jgi:HEAT repeat protein
MGRVYLNDRESSVRGQAALAVAWALGPAGVSDLQRLLFDRDPSVQLVAAKAILVATAPR